MYLITYQDTQNMNENMGFPKSFSFCLLCELQIFKILLELLYDNIFVSSFTYEI